MTPAGEMSTLAGKAGETGHVDGPALTARFKRLHGVAVDEKGFVYVADGGNHSARRIAADGNVDVATFSTPAGLAYANKHLFVSDSDGQTIRRLR